MSLALPALIGAGATALGLLAAGIARSRAVAPVVLVAVASFYPVFAAERGADQLWPLLGLAAFAVLALLAARIAPRLAALGLIAHGLIRYGHGANDACRAGLVACVLWQLRYSAGAVPVADFEKGRAEP